MNETVRTDKVREKNYDLARMVEEMQQIFEERDKEYKRLNQIYDERDARLKSMESDFQERFAAIQEKEEQLGELETELEELQDALNEKGVKLEAQNRQLNEEHARWQKDYDDKVKAFSKSQSSMQMNLQLELERVRNQKLTLDREKEELADKMRRLGREPSFVPDAAALEMENKRLSEENSTLRNTSVKWQEETELLKGQIQELKTGMEDAAAKLEESQRLRAETMQKLFAANKKLKQMEEGALNVKRLEPEEMEQVLVGHNAFSDVHTLHAADGDIVVGHFEKILFHFAFKEIPFFDLSVNRDSSKEMERKILQLNTKIPEYKFFYENDRVYAMSWFLPDSDPAALLERAMKAAEFFE